MNCFIIGEFIIFYPGQGQALRLRADCHLIKLLTEQDFPQIQSIKVRTQAAFILPDAS